ncbi:type I glyceraldehyde-3-phosphate dehydrogenase [Synechococcus sp. PCC 7336]|uniref:type I glyceraldehyde-3-phosphate dehydrogenase n=1 Tax=Synechococcus sp. PCC 7336 TaxID=195250 RepID=UPI00035D6A48|nr:type I glyceraldehyde-3-phosphate dehydrogenase [Synechococcus sp. PCC 7336]
MIKVAINGFGRIGRNFLRCWLTRANSGLDIVAINDTGDANTSAHLLKYDSILGPLEGVNVEARDGKLLLDDKAITVVSDRNPNNLPWKAMGIDLVIEATGVFRNYKGAARHVEAGAKKVMITAPAKGSDVPTYVYGVNQNDYDPVGDIVVSNASCTTNCLAPILKVILEKFGVVRGIMTTTHSYTGDQRLLDNTHRDLRRARAAALSIVPTTTGAATAVALVLPELKGKLGGLAVRVPTPNVSLVDLVVQTEQKVIAEEVNGALKEASENGLAGILGYSEVPLVSIDYRRAHCSSVVDSLLTTVLDGDLVKLMAWYDNEWGYSQRVVDLAEHMSAKWQG